MTSLAELDVGGVIGLVVGDIRFICFVVEGDMDTVCVPVSLASVPLPLPLPLRRLAATANPYRCVRHGRSLVGVASMLCEMR